MALSNKVDPATIFNIEELTINNINFRKVVHTSKHQQWVVMSLAPGEDIGMEIHEDTDQFIRIEAGFALFQLEDAQPMKVDENFGMTVTAGTNHNVVNASSTEHLKLYTIYSPPHHPPGLIQQFKPCE